MNEPETRQEHLDNLKAELNGWMPSDGTVEELLDASAEALAEFDGLKHRTGNALNIQTAESIDDLEPYGNLVDEYPKSTDTVATYKKRVLMKFKQLSVSGRPNEVLAYAASLFEVDPKKVTLENVSDTPNFNITVSSKVLNSSTLSNETAGDLLRDLGAATYGGKISALGSFIHVSVEDYENNNYDSSKGYATLDSNGDITSGGAYGTVYK